MSTTDLDLDSVVAVAKKDFQDAARSKVLWLVTGLFVAFLGGMAFLFVWFDDLLAQQGEEVAAAGLISFLQSPVTIVIPLIGLLVGYKALAGEVSTGSAKILLSLPHSRLDAVLGKFLGRTLVLWASFFVGLVVALVVIVVTYDQFNLGQLAVFTVLSLLFGAVYVGLGVAISAATKSTTKAAAGVVFVFFFFYFVFDSLRTVVYYLVTGNAFPPLESAPPDWYTLFPRLSPGGAYQAALVGFLPGGEIPADALYPEGSEAFYFSRWVALAILLVWIVVPVVVGYLQFERLDL